MRGDSLSTLLDDLTPPDGPRDAAGDGGADGDAGWRRAVEAVASRPLPSDLLAPGWHPVLDVIRDAAVRRVDVPLAEAAIASAVAGVAGLEVTPRAVAAHGRVALTRHGSGWSVDAELPRVPWGRVAEQVVVVGDSGAVLRLPVAAATLHRGANLAGEPRDTLAFSRHPVGPDDLSDAGALPADVVVRLGALARAVAIAGALETLSDLVIDHAGQRRQFGRPLDRFQAVQAHLVSIASETASAGMAAAVGRRALPPSAATSGADAHDARSRVAVAVAKTRTAAAATSAARSAHQVLGAIGTTELHPLGDVTRRLWSWRDEHGTQAFWQRTLGTMVTAAGGVGLWDLVTDQSEQAEPSQPSEPSRADSS